MGAIIDQGGIAPGGLNFDCKVRRESTDDVDLFIGHIGAMDCFAKGLRNAVKIREEGVLPGMVKERYSSYDEGLGKKIEDGTLTLEECEAFIIENGDPKQISGKQELYEMVLNRYM